MSILLFLNELSCGTPQPPDKINQAMEEFVGLLRQVRKRRGDAALVTLVKREELELAQGYYINQWISAGRRNRDLWRVVQSMRNQSPFTEVLPYDDAMGSEYTCGEQEAKGVQAAHRLNGLLVSIPVDPQWDVSWVDAMCIELGEEPDGDPEIYPVRVRHAAKSPHLTVHADWLGEAGLAALRAGSEIWEARGDLYPHIDFLPRVEGQLRTLIPEWVLPVANRLRSLEEAVAGWDRQQAAEPSWVNVTPEAENRKKLCWFVDGDVKQLFDLHARFTPGAGRIHLRPLRNEGKIRIAHIGRKIE